ncbi:hypothetical protein BDW74DRAFT_179055 [Aspergillus multicolor]|uniref:uncharacterized protein n=1 Tax=Aspergillus multicolor TaxID=41759 RepID=UPI003CCE4B69
MTTIYALGTGRGTWSTWSSRRHVLGKSLFSPGFRNIAIDGICAKLNEKLKDGLETPSLPGRDVIKYIYENTLDNAPIRKLMVDIWWDHMESSSLTEERDTDLPQPFAVDLAIIGFDRRQLSPKALKSSKAYHCAL